MGKRGFSATTGVLVAILIGALYMVGKTVTPPPPGPPEPPPVAKQVSDPVAMPGKGAGGMSPAARAKMMKEMMEREKQKHGIPPGKGKKPAVKKFDPYSIEITPAWNLRGDREPGHEGVVKLTEEVQRAKALDAAQRKAHPIPPKTAAQPQSGAVPSGTPVQPQSGAVAPGAAVQPQPVH